MSVLNHSPRIVNDGLILCLDAASIRSYSGSGAEWSDLSGSDFDATITGATWRHHGDASDLYKTGAAVFDFDATNDEVNNSKKPSAGLLGSSYCFWIRHYLNNPCTETSIVVPLSPLEAVLPAVL